MTTSIWSKETWATSSRSTSFCLNIMIMFRIRPVLFRVTLHEPHLLSQQNCRDLLCAAPVLELMKAKALGGKMSDLSKTYQYQYVQELHLVVCVLSTVQFFKKTTEKNAFIVFSNQIVLVSIICWKIWVGSAGSDSAYSLPFSASFLLSIAQLLGFGLLFRCFSLPWRAWNVESIHVLSFAMFYDFMCSVFYTLQLTDFCCSSVRQLWGSQFHSFNSYCTEQLFESVLCQSWLAC